MQLQRMAGAGLWSKSLALLCCRRVAEAIKDKERQAEESEKSVRDRLQVS